MLQSRVELADAIEDVPDSMNQRTLTRAARSPLALLAAWLTVVASLCLSAPSLATPRGTDGAPSLASTPSPSSHRIGSLCPAPSPGRSGCLGLRLVSDEPQAERKSPIAGSLGPASVQKAYGLSRVTPPSTQTIALVDAYDDATVAADLAVFDSRFGLPACTEANGCLRKVNQNGAASPLPPSSGREERGWAQEIATDVEVAHGVCPSCLILLVEANTNKNEDLYAAEQTAVALGASEISNSWGGEEPSVDSPAFDHPGIVITASAGDEGYLDWLTGERAEAAQYPASSPHVVGVGGTRLALNAETGAWEGETVWNDGGANGLTLEGAGAAGGGCSARFGATSWQQGVPDWSSLGCPGTRAVADVAADADPYTGVAVYDSTETPEGEKGWTMIGGTSVASPIIAAAFALAGGSYGVAYPSRTLYESLLSDPASLHDVVSGSNGECRKRPSKTGAASCTPAEESQTCAAQSICLAGPGYDGPSGVGTPAGVDAFLPPSEHTSVGASASGASGATPVAPPAATGSSAPGTGASGAGPPASGPPAPTPAPMARPTILALRLTHAASAALRRRHARLSRLTFAFKLSAPARVRVSLAKRVRVHGRIRWLTLHGAFTILAPSGPQTRRPSGRATLAAGRYRLTLAPAGGVAGSLTFSAG